MTKDVGLTKTNTFLSDYIYMLLFGIMSYIILLKSYKVTKSWSNWNKTKNSWITGHVFDFIL